MPTPRAGAVAAFLTIAAFLSSPRAVADDPKPPPAKPPDKPPEKPSDKPPDKPADKPPAAKEVPLQVLSDAEAAPLLEGLKKAAKTRNGIEAMPALDAIGGKTHKEFEPLLTKMLSHLSADVAVRAASAIADRGNDKTSARLWAAWGATANRERYDVKGAILLAMARLGAKLDPKQYDEVAALWKAAPSDAALIGIAKYFETIKTDKRPCRIFAEFIHEPLQSGNVNDGANPPAEYWKAKWQQWHNVTPAVQDALKAITGQIFNDTSDAKAWFKAHEKDFGFVW